MCTSEMCSIRWPVESKASEQPDHPHRCDVGSAGPEVGTPLLSCTELAKMACMAGLLKPKLSTALVADCGRENGAAADDELIFPLLNVGGC